MPITPSLQPMAYIGFLPTTTTATNLTKARSAYISKSYLFPRNPTSQATQRADCKTKRFRGKLRNPLTMSIRVQKGFLKALSARLKGKNSPFGSPTAAPSGGSGPVKKGQFFPVYVAAGMIVLAAGFGIHTARHQLSRSPNVHLKKSRRETVPEVVDPAAVADDSEQFIKKSIFRKVAHVQDIDRQEVMSDPIRGDVFARQPKTETLESVGVNPNPTTTTQN